MIIILLSIALIVAGLFIAVQTWVLTGIVKRNQRLEFELEDRDKATFRDIQTMFVLQELLDVKTLELSDAFVCIEMLLTEEDPLGQNKPRCRTVLDG